MRRPSIITLALVLAACGTTPASTTSITDTTVSTTVAPTTTTTLASSTTEASSTTTTTVDVSGVFVEDPASPVLTPGDWDSGYTAVPDVVWDGDRWLMFYSGKEKGQPTSPAVGVAESTDGITWTRPYDGPVYTRPGEGAGPSWVFTHHDGDRWVLFYTTAWSVGYTSIYRVTAPSLDGPWSDEVEVLEPPRDDWNRRVLVTGLSVIDGTWWMPYSGFDINGKNGSIGYWTSPDGETWTSVEAPILTPDREWNRFGVVPTNVIQTERGLELFYLGFDRPPDIAIRQPYSDILFGRLISTDGGETWVADADGQPIGSTGEKGWPGVSVVRVDDSYRLYLGDDLGAGGIKLVTGSP